MEFWISSLVILYCKLPGVGVPAKVRNGIENNTTEKKYKKRYIVYPVDGFLK